MNWSVRRLRRRWSAEVDTDDIRSAVHEAAVHLIRRDGDGFDVRHLAYRANGYLCHHWRWMRQQCRDGRLVRRVVLDDLPAAVREADERLAFLTAAVASLSPFDRAVLERMDEPREETAKALAVSVNQLRHRRAVVVRAVRAMMPESLFDH